MSLIYCILSYVVSMQEVNLAHLPKLIAGQAKDATIHDTEFVTDLNERSRFPLFKRWQPAMYGPHPLAGVSWTLSSKSVKPIALHPLKAKSGDTAANGTGYCLVDGILPEGLITSGTGAQTPLHYEDAFMGAFNLLIGPSPKVLDSQHCLA